MPERSTSAYWNTQPTPVASGPSSVRTPSGSVAWIFDRYSSTRDRAQYRSVPSSKMTYTYEKPKSENPRTALTCGAPSWSLALMRNLKEERFSTSSKVDVLSTGGSAST